MGLYKLRAEDENIESAILEKAKTDTIDYEKDFENWLENSPAVLLDDEHESTVIWIGRQVTASVGEIDKYPDLIGIDSSGNLVIVELKKGRVPREVIAQLLEYTAWGAALNYEELNQIACSYFKKQDTTFDKNLLQVYRETFFPDSENDLKIEFNKNQRLFVVAEEISPVVRQVTNHLRTRYQVDIYCMEYEVLKSQQGEYFVSTEKIVGYDEVGFGKSTSTNLPRWSQPIKVKTVISETVKKLTNGEYSAIFSPVEAYNELIKQYPDINKNTVNCQIIQDCVNHTSRKYYPSGQQDLYFWVEKGKYRLYNPATDGKWNWKGEKIL